MVQRADELAAQSEIESNRSFNQGAKGIAKTAVSAGLGAGGGALSARIAPFFSEFISPELAVKGISKISPEIGAFLKSGQDNGLDIQGGLDYLKQHLPEEKEEPAKDDRNPIEKHSPNLFQYLKDLISSGSSPGQAAQKAKKFLDKPMQELMKKIEKEYKTDWTSLVESIFGNTGAQQSPSMDMQEAGNAQMMRGQQQPQQGSQNEQRLLSAVQQLRQTRGR